MTDLTDSQAATTTNFEESLCEEVQEDVAEHGAVPLRIRVAERCFDWRERLPTLREAREAFDRVYLEELLRRVGGNVSAAARLSGRNRTDLYDLLRRTRVDPSLFRPARALRSERDSAGADDGKPTSLLGSGASPSAAVDGQYADACIVQARASCQRSSPSDGQSLPAS